MIAPLSRIIARYLAASLVTYGLVAAPDVAFLEPQIATIAGVILSASVEAAYAFAKRRGWAT